MSFNPSRAEKTDGQLRKPGRSGSSGQQNYHREYSGSGKGGGAGGSTVSSAPLNPSISSSSATHPLSTSRSFKKPGGGLGSQSRVGFSTTSPEAAIAGNTHPSFQNGTTNAAASANPIRNAPRVVPKAPSSQASWPSSNAASTVTAKGDASKQMTLQFGTINPVDVNGLLIPARTSSAPPNLDEQKHDQARHEAFRAIPTAPMSTAPKLPQQQQAKKDVTAGSQSTTAESQPPLLTKRNVPVAVQPSPAVPSPRPSVFPMNIPFQRPQTQVPMQFGGPNSQMQPQGLVANSLQMTMPVPVAGAHHVAQQFYYPGQLLQQQAMMHPGQSMGFPPPIGHHLSPQIGSLGIGVPSQYSQQQQPGKLVGPRKSTVKITHPDTHEELRLDERTDSFKDGMPSNQRTLSNVPQQPQSIATYNAHQMNYYPSVQPNAYSPVQHPFPTSTSISLTSSQVPVSSQASRYNYAVNQSGLSINFMNSTNFNPIPGGKSHNQTSLYGVSEENNLQTLPVSASSTLASKIIVRPAIASHVEKVVAPTLTSSVTISAPNKADAPNMLKPTADVTHHRQGDAPQDNQNQQPKSAESNAVAKPVKDVSLPVSDGFSSSVTPALLLQKAMPETSSSSACLTPSEDSGFVPATNVIKEGEPARRSGSLNDNQIKTSKKNLNSTQPDPQLDPSYVAESLKISSPKNSKDSAAEESSTSFENIQASLASTPATTLFGSKVKKDGAVEHNASLASSCSLETVVGSTSSEDATSVAVDSVSLASEATPVKDTGLPGSSVSLESAVDHNIGKKLDADKAQEDTCLNSGGKVNSVQATSLGKTEVSEIISKGFGDADLNLNSDIDKSSKVVDQISPPWKKGDSKLDNAKSCEYDEIKAPTSTALQYSDLEEPERSTIATEHKVMDIQVVDLTNFDALETPIMPDTGFSSTAEKSEAKISESCSEGVVSALGLATKEKPSSETSKHKAFAGKKKKKDICAKADAAGTSDLYNAYEGPKEYHQASSASEIVDCSSSSENNFVDVDNLIKEDVASEEDFQSRTELEDWEDAADMSTPKLKVEEHIQPLNGEAKQHEEGNDATSRKKYSKDFLLTFQQQITELPLGFQISPDIAESLLSISLGKSNFVDREQYPSPGRIIDRPSGASRMDRRMADDDRWTRPGSFVAGRDLRSDVVHGAAVSLRPGQGSNHGPSRNMRTPPFNGGILSGPQPLVPPGGMPRGNSDADRWQRATGFQRGLIPSPQTPLQVMHKAEKKYEVGKVTDEEEAKQRLLKGILNKLTPQNFDKLFAKVKEVNIDNAVTLPGVISQIFDKALMEPTFCEMYASFCVQLAGALPEIIEDNEKITFRGLLLNKCQEEFERGEREQAEADEADEEGETKQSKEEREERRITARRRMLGNIRLIGELYKKKMLIDKIMHDCIIKLLGQYENPDEENIECLCKLMATIGEIIDHPKAKDHMDAYFNMMGKLSTNMKLSSRLRFMLKDAIDLRRNKWRQRRKVEGPKKIEEVHRDAAQERQAQSSRLARGPSISSGSRRGPVGDFNTRGPPPLNSLNSQHVGGIRAMPSQVRGYVPRDLRLDDRHQFESKTLLLPHRTTDDDSITLGPQGGLGRGMSIRGQPLMPNPSTAENVSFIMDHRRVVSDQNGNNPHPDWTSHASREDTSNRYSAERFSEAIYDQPGSQDCKIYGASRESRTLNRNFDRPTNLAHAEGTYVSSANSQPLASETKTYSEDVLREKSKLAIREFYSAKDEEEVALCIKELNSPSFYPSMLSLWVTDSFGRKDMERELLAKLIVNLCGGSVVSQKQLIEGFSDILASLEDAVKDAPKAAEFLGRIFARVIVEKAITLRDVGRLIQEGGEEPGRLREIGLAAEVLGSILESIIAEKGESLLNEITASSNLNLDDFRPPQPLRSRKLDPFL